MLEVEEVDGNGSHKLLNVEEVGVAGRTFVRSFVRSIVRSFARSSNKCELEQAFTRSVHLMTMDLIPDTNGG